MPFLGDKMKKNEMGRACDTNSELSWSRLRLRLRFISFFIGALLRISTRWWNVRF
jgi:hypothetical protein